MRPQTVLLPALSIGSHAFASQSSAIDPSSAKARQIYRAEPGSWFENLLVRSNGNILATRLDIPSLYEIDPKSGAAAVIVNFTGVTAASGIAEYAPDVFAVIVGNLTTQGGVSATPGTYSIQTVNLTTGLGPNGKVTPTLLADIPGGELVNGLAFQPPSTLYASDSSAYNIWGIDTKTRAVTVASPRNMLYDNSTAGGIPLGINGLKWDANAHELVWTNTDQLSVGLTPFVGRKLAAPVKLATGINGTIGYDDFDIDREGNYYLANVGDKITYLRHDGKTQFFIEQNNTLVLDEPTATHFGVDATKNVLYIATAGRIDGNAVGAQIVEYTFNSA